MHRLFELASAQSLWRGVDYYKKRKVISFSPQKTDKASLLYTGLVRGRSSSEDDNYSGSPRAPIRSPEEAKQYNKPDAPIYHVTVNPERPRNSTCDCPFAKGRHVVCKHIVALFIEAEPKQLDKLYEEIKERAEKAKEEEQRERFSRREELEREASCMLRYELERAYVEKSIRLDECVEELREISRSRWGR